MDRQLARFQLYAAHAAEQPAADGPVGVVIEGIVRRAVGANAVPGFPDGGGALFDGVEPAGTILLQQQAIGGIHVAVLRQHPAQIRRGQEARIQVAAVLDDQRVEGVRRLPVFLSVQQAKGDGPHVFALAVRFDFSILCAGEAVRLFRVLGDLGKARSVLRLVQDPGDLSQQGSGTEIIGRGHLGRALHGGFAHGLGVVDPRLAPLAKVEAHIHQIILPGVIFVLGPGLMGAVFAEGQPAGHHIVVFFQDGLVPIGLIQGPGHQDTGVAPPGGALEH